MTKEAVHQAIATLQRQGKSPSSRNILRVLRNTGPRYMGCSFRDLLPWLRHQHDTGKDCYRQVLEMYDAIESALRHPDDPRLPALLSRGQEVWRTCAPRLQAVTISVDGPTAALLWPHAVQQFRYILATASKAIRG
jgi:hypothetical protein